MIFDESIPSSVSKLQCERLAQLGRGKLVLELGSWHGRSTVLLASVAKMLHAVDWHRGDPHSGNSDTLGPMVQKLRQHGLEDSVVLHVGRNEDVLPLFRDGLFDLIFVDSFHTYEAVQRDIDLTRRLLAPDGIMVFHDYGLTLIQNGIPFGVTAAVDDFAQREGWKVEQVEAMAVLVRNFV